MDKFKLLTIMSEQGSRKTCSQLTKKFTNEIDAPLYESSLGCEQNGQTKAVVLEQANRFTCTNVVRPAHGSPEVMDAFEPSVARNVTVQRSPSSGGFLTVAEVYRIAASIDRDVRRSWCPR